MTLNRLATGPSRTMQHALCILALACALCSIGLACPAYADDLAAASPAPTAQSGSTLSPGVYAVPVALMKADDHSASSGAAAAFANEARLSVGSGGVATLSVDVSPVTFGSITGYATDYRVYLGDSTESDAVCATVVEYAVDEAGNKLCDKDGNAVPARIGFAVPNLDWDGVYLSMHVDIMGSSPDAWLRIDYANAALDGQPVTYTGTKHVEQFGGYDVNVSVAVQGGIIQGLEIEGANYAGSDAAYNEAKLAAAVEGMRDKWTGMWIGHGHSNAEALYKAGGDELDTVSGATYSCKAIRDALMAALNISWTDEAINVPSSPLAPGTYTVNVSYYTDIVLHQLAGAENAPASLRVGKDGSLALDLNLSNGTAREPLYTMKINGYYEGNDASGALSDEGMSQTFGKTDYSDAYFPAGTNVVEHVRIPLVGGYAREYTTQAYLYVPVMNALDGEQNGITFDHGRFDVNAYLKVNWDSAKLVKSIAQEEAEEKARLDAERAAAEDEKAASSQKLSYTKSFARTFGAKPFKLGVRSSYSNVSFAYKSSNPKVAAVSKSGNVTPKAPGSATVTVTATAKAKSGKTSAKTVKVSVKVKLSKSVLTAKTKSTKKARLRAAWKTVKGAQGYQLKTGKKTYTVKGAKTLKKTVKATAGKKVKVRVRAWSKASGKKVYGAWSKARTVKVK